MHFGGHSMSSNVTNAWGTTSIGDQLTAGNVSLQVKRKTGVGSPLPWRPSMVQPSQAQCDMLVHTSCSCYLWWFSFISILRVWAPWDQGLYCGSILSPGLGWSMVQGRYSRMFVDWIIKWILTMVLGPPSFPTSKFWEDLSILLLSWASWSLLELWQ